jgi:hypothetical protein
MVGQCSEKLEQRILNVSTRKNVTSYPTDSLAVVNSFSIQNPFADVSSPKDKGVSFCSDQKVAHAW